MNGLDDGVTGISSKLGLLGFFKVVIERFKKGGKTVMIKMGSRRSAERRLREFYQ